MFELAHGGTLFLDEIGEMPLSLQSRILRVLQEREVMPLGGESIIPIDVRIIAATNQNLSKMVEEGRFRSDLYYRLNILRIHMPTLAERKEDIPLLADKLLQKMQDINPNLKSITKEAKLFLSNCKWPGNIRQFVNMMERIMLLTDGDTITKQDVINAYEDDKESLISNEKEIIECTESINTVDKNLAQMEIELLHKILVEENYNYTKAAKRLGIHRTTLWRKLKNK
jgi:transcriptional regulator with PAS, ATPase and Fis domain